MTDQSWRRCEGTWDRLKWARRRVFETAKDAAASMAIKEGTYRAYEREPWKSKAIALDHQNAVRFGRKFKVRWEWLLLGTGEPHLGDEEGPKARAKRAVDQVSDEQAEAVALMLERMLKTGTDG